ncbi:MAG: RDD family protein [Candidatus Palauibacterales bacterium]|nr:RDD family protein [Candidatus Palauibacterales bacterium]
MSSERDPREIITPDAFSVAPELLGLPLAHPWRRAVAILIDLFLIALLANAKSFLLALAAGTFLFWLAFRGRKAGLGSTAARTVIGCGGALVVFIAVIAIWATVFVDDDTVLFQATGDGGQPVPITVGVATDFASLLGTSDTIEAEAAAARVVRRMEGQGVGREEMREILENLRAEGDAPVIRAIERAIGTSSSSVGADASSPDLDSLLAAYGAARAAGDTARETSIGAVLGRRLAQSEWQSREREVSRLQERADRVQADLTETERQLEAERNRGIISSVVGFLDELGLGVGWSGLYFTFLTGFFRGQTPGKRALGIRVLRLDGEALNYWVAFERFGGYAASLFTGMEGFLRIMWDRNRQCLQDKLAETVVIRETKTARAQLAVGAAKRGLAERPWKGGPIPGT